MTKAEPLGIYRNAKVISQSPNKKFALVEVDGTSYVASKAADADLQKGAVIVVEFFTEGRMAVV